MDEVIEASARLRPFINKAVFREFIRSSQLPHLDWMHSHAKAIVELEARYASYIHPAHTHSGHRRLQALLICEGYVPEFEAICKRLNAYETDPHFTLIARDGADGLKLPERCLIVARYWDATTSSRELWAEHPMVQTLHAEAYMLRMSHGVMSDADATTHFARIGAVVESVIDEYESRPECGNAEVPPPSNEIMREALRAVVDNGLAGVVSVAANSRAAERASASMHRLLDQDATRCEWTQDKWVRELGVRGQAYSKKTIARTKSLKDGGWSRCLALREEKKRSRMVSKETGKHFLYNEVV